MSKNVGQFAQTAPSIDYDDMSDPYLPVNDNQKYPDTDVIGEGEYPGEYPYWMKGYQGYAGEGGGWEEMVPGEKSESTLKSTTIHNYSISADTSYLTLPEQTISYGQIKLTPTEETPSEHKPCKETKKTKVCRRPLKGKREVAAIKYFKQYKILEFLSFLMKHVLVKQPDDLIKFLIELLDECILFRGGVAGIAPSLFQDRHIISIYKAFDPIDAGFISGKQYKVAMKTLGVTEYPPLGAEYKVKQDCNRIFKVPDKRIKRDDFLKLAKISLSEQLLDLLTVPTPTEEMTDYSPYSLRETDVTPTPEHTETPISSPKLIVDLARIPEEQVLGEGEYMMDEYMFAEAEYAEEKEVSIVPSIPEEPPVKEVKKEKPEILELHEHPQLKVKVYHEKPMITEFIDMVKSEPKLATPVKSTASAYAGLGEYEMEEASTEIIPSETLQFQEIFIKPKREGRPLISSHTKGWSRPDRHFMKTLEQVKLASRQRLVESLDFLKPKPQESISEHEEQSMEFSEGHAGIWSQYFIPGTEAELEE